MFDNKPKSRIDFALDSLIFDAAYHGQAEIVATLLATPSIKIVPQELDEALRVAVRPQHSHVVKILLQKTVDIDRILSLDAENSTLLHIAVLNGDEETVKLLLGA